VGDHHVIIRSHTQQLTIELASEDSQFMGQELNAWASALLSGNASSLVNQGLLASSISLQEDDALPAVPPMQAQPVPNANIPESVTLPLPAAMAPQTINDEPEDAPVLVVTEVAATEAVQEDATLSLPDTDPETPEVVASVDAETLLTSNAPNPFLPEEDATEQANTDVLLDVAKATEDDDAEEQAVLPVADDTEPTESLVETVDEAIEVQAPTLTLPKDTEAEDAAEGVEAASALTAPASQADGFDNVLNQIMADMADDAPSEKEDDETLVTSVAASATMTEADEVAEALAANGVIESLADVCELVQPETPEACLLAAGYYLMFFEAQEKFSLKQINSQLLQANESSISHSVLAVAIEGEHLSLVPDATGEVDTPEYQLTDQARKLVEGWIKAKRQAGG
jgi:hypothetical protein